MAGADGEQLEWLSTTGGPDQKSGDAAVLLRRSNAVKARTLPAEIKLGAGHVEAITLGRHKDNFASLQMKAVSKIHCQFALRSFRIPGEEQVHQALFLRDVAKNKTFVNGKLAFRPWHWLQHGDGVGLHTDESGASNVFELFQVNYQSLVKLPGRVKQPSAASFEKPVPAAAFDKGVRRPPLGKLGKQQAPARPAAPSAAGTLAKNIDGRIVDITYHDSDPPATFRVKIVGYNTRRKWHKVNSEGFSTWDGDSFTDEVDLNKMLVDGHVRFVEEGPGKKKPRLA